MLRESGRSHAMVALLLGALVLTSLGLSLGGGFVWDDAPLIVDNRRVQEPGEFGKILTDSFWETDDRHDGALANFSMSSGRGGSR